MPNGEFSFLGSGLSPTGTTSSLPIEDAGPLSSLTGFQAVSPETTLVEELLAKYQARPPEPPPRLSTGQKIAGALGDALQAYAAVRAGGQAPPIGGFAASVMARQRDYEARAAKFEQQRLDSLESLTRIQEQANIRQDRAERQRLMDLIAEQKQGGFLTQEEDPENPNNVLNIRYVTDAAGNIIKREVLGKRPVAQIVVPGAQGFQVVDRPTATARPVTGAAGEPVLAVPPVGAVQRSGFLAAGKGVFDKFRSLSTNLAQKGVNFAPTFGQERLRIGRPGRVVSGMINPDVEQLLRQKELLGEAIVNILTGAQVAEPQIQRLLNQLPDPSLLATENGRATFFRTLDDTEQFFNTLLETQAKGFPAITPGTSGAPRKKTAEELADEMGL